MGIGAAIKRSVPRDMRELREQRSAYGLRGHWRKRWRFAQQEQGPHPRQAADGDFQAGLPIDADSGGILIDPGQHLGDSFRRESFVAGEQPGFGQPRQMLLTVELVNDFGIAARRVMLRAILRPEGALPRSPGVRIAMPVDGVAQVRWSEIQKFYIVASQRSGLENGAADPLRKIAV